MNKFLILALSCILLAACTKQAPEQVPGQNIRVDILAPLPHSSFKNGDTLRISIHCSDNEAIKEVFLKVYDKKISAPFLDIEKMMDAGVKSYGLDTFIVINSSEVSEYEIEAFATDISGNSNTARHYCHISP